MKDDPAVRWFEAGSRIAFGAIALVFALFALGMVAYGIGQTIEAIYTQQDLGTSILNGLGYVVIAIAVFEVAKYLVEEEMVREREMRAPAEARRSLTKFISTISIAVFLEGLVTVYRVSLTNVTELVYPSLLLLTAMAMIIGLGVFQRLSATVEAQVEPTDRRANTRQR